MSYLETTSVRYSNAKEMAADFFKNANSIPCQGGYTIRENLGTFYFGLEHYSDEDPLPSTDSYEDMKEKSKHLSNDKRIIFHKEGNVSINFHTCFDVSSVPNYRRRYHRGSTIDILNSNLPESIYLWEHGEDRIYATFSAKGDTVRPRDCDCVNPAILYELGNKKEMSEVVTFFPISEEHPKGKVDNAKKIKRGPTIFSEDKPLSQHLSGKHYT